MSYTKYSMYLLSCYIVAFCAHADDLSDAFNNVVNTVKNTGVSMGVGIAETFSGECLRSNCYYTFAIWNDSPGPIRAAREDVKKVMGVDFDGDIIESYVIAPFDHFGGAQGTPFYHSNLYFKVALQIDKNNENMYQNYSKIHGTPNKPFWQSLYRKNIAIPDPDSTHVYYYRVYSQQGVVKAEYLGLKTTSDQFSGVFYNNTTTPVHLKFLKNSVSYQVTLEPGTFSILNSDPNTSNSIRPTEKDKEQRFFTFLNNGKQFMQIPVTPIGICNLLPDPKKQGAFTVGDPMVYTYEVYQGHSGLAAGMQGLAIGHYTQMADPKDQTKIVVRDINPVQCSVWLQSADQAKQQLPAAQQAESNFFDFPGQVWLLYQTSDWSLQQKITPGSVTDFMLLRPKISEQQASVYVVALNTQDDTKAKQWISRFLQGTIGKDATKVVDQIQKFDASTVFTTIVANPAGTIDDSAQNGSGLTGMLLVADSFTPRGVGSGPFYYTIPPLIVRLDQLQEIFNSFFDGKKVGTAQDQVTLSQTLAQKIVSWIKIYSTQGAQVTNDVIALLTKYGADRLLSSTAKGQLTALGKKALDMILTGPVSIKNYPAIVQAGNNEYILSGGEKPTSWPAKST